MFNVTNYLFWKVMIKNYIQSLGIDVWDAMEEEYQKPQALITRD